MYVQNTRICHKTLMNKKPQQNKVVQDEGLQVTGLGSYPQLSSYTQQYFKHNKV